MAINAICTNCLQKTKVGEKFAGRKALCPLCESSILIPKAGEQAAEAAPLDFVTVIDRFKISDWDKLYCKAVTSQGLAKERAVRSAVIDVRKRMRSGQGKLPIGEVFVTDGVISGAQHQKISDVISRKSEPSRAGAEEAKKACPNCFETISADSKKCPYCAEDLGDLRIMDMCPNCKHQQPPAGRFCQECGADIETGLVGGVSNRKCPRCGMMSSGTETICPICKTSFDKPAGLVTAERTAKKVVTTFRNNVGYLILLAMIIAGLWAYKHREELWTGFRSELHGASETQLQDAVDEWIEALKYGDLGTLNAMVTKGRIEKSDIASILGHPGTEIQEILSIEKSDTNTKKDRAVVYVATKIRIPPKDTPGGGGNLEMMSKLLGGDESSKTIHTAKTAWHWALKDKRWLYVNE